MRLIGFRKIRCSWRLTHEEQAVTFMFRLGQEGLKPLAQMRHTGVYCAAHSPLARSPSYLSLPVPFTEEDMMRRFLGGFSIGVLSVFLTAGLAWAQLSTAQLSGRITDQSAAVLPGVTVTATQTATGFTRSDDDD